MELRYEYNDDESKRTSAVDQTAAEWSTYGPEKYVVEYEYDSVGQVARKVVRDTPSDDDSTRFEVDYTYDGRGQLIRERIWRYDVVSEMMLVTQDIETRYDLGRNPTFIKFSDNSGWAYTEARTYARGHQLTGFSTTNATGVTVSASGSYTYDDNNNLLTTKSLSVYRTAGAYLTIREAWTFTYDRKNRLQSYTNGNAAGDVGHIWYDGRGRVWQRWVYVAGSEWDSNVTRYVYDGSAYAQEHNFTVANVSNAWVYTYDQILTDYLRKPGGVRQRDISTVDQCETDQFLLSDSGSVSARIQRETNSLVQRVELTSSGTAQAAGSQQDTTISKLGLRGGYTETFSGSTEFDPLVQMGDRHVLAGLGWQLSREGNHPYIGLVSWNEYKAFVRCFGYKHAMFTSVGPKLPQPSDACQDMYWEECLSPDWDFPHYCPDCTRPFLQRRNDWFKFCCDPNCIHNATFHVNPIGPHVGCPCGENATCEADCHCDHCRWSFGFLPGDDPSVKKSCGNITLDPTCYGIMSQADLDEALAKACFGAAPCACITYKDKNEQTQVEIGYGPIKSQLYGWRNFYACLANYCRGKKTLTIKCGDCNTSFGDINCCGSDMHGHDDQGRSICAVHQQGTTSMTLCLANCPSTCKGNIILHEIMHICGMNETGAYHFADKCVRQKDCGWAPPAAVICNVNAGWTGPCF